MKGHFILFASGAVLLLMASSEDLLAGEYRIDLKQQLSSVYEVSELVTPLTGPDQDISEHSASRGPEHFKPEIPPTQLIAQKATGFESPDYQELTYHIAEMGENSFCLTATQIGSRVELRLLQHGISPRTGTIREDYPRLKIGIHFEDDFFSIQFDLQRISIFSVGDVTYWKDASMWNEQVLGPHQFDLDVIYNSLDYLLASFLSQYLSANELALH